MEYTEYRRGFPKDKVESAGLGQLLRAIQSITASQIYQVSRYRPPQMGSMEIQETQKAFAQGVGLATEIESSRAVAVPSLEARSYGWTIGAV